MLSSFTILVVLAHHSNVVIGLPRIEFALNAQVPPVAVVDKEYAFVFSSSTFRSDRETTFALENGPAWLHLNPTTRTLFGVPSNDDLGNDFYQIRATDSDGSILADAELVVLGKSELRADGALFKHQLREAGLVSGPTTVSIYPQAPLALEFGQQLFLNSKNDCYYYALSADNSPLPAWVSFDPSTIALTGTAPSLLTPQSSPQIFGFAIVASTRSGFSQARVEFQISIANHVLTFENASQYYNVLTDNEVKIPSLLDTLHRDGEPLSVTRIAEVSSNHPTWLLLDAGHLSFEGHSPVDAVETSFQLNVTDDQRNVASAEIVLHFGNSQDQDAARTFLGTVNATAGSYFNYTFAGVGHTDSRHVVNIDLSSGSEWLAFSATNMSIQGMAPLSPNDNLFNVTLEFHDGGRIKDTEFLAISVSPPTVVPTRTADDTSHRTGQSKPTDQQSDPASDPESIHAPVPLALMIALPILAAVFVLSILLVYLSRRRRLQRETTSRQSNETSMQQNGMFARSGNLVIIESGESSPNGTTPQPPSSPPPRVDLPWRKHGMPAGRNAFLGGSSIGSPESRSSWDDLLFEVESPMSSAFQRGPDPISPPIPSRTVPGKVASPPRERMGLSNWNNANQRPVVPTPDQVISRPKQIRFNGRRSSGLGHGRSLRNSNVSMPRITMRQVPLSPLSESPELRNLGQVSTRVSWGGLPPRSNRNLHLSLSNCLRSSTVHSSDSRKSSSAGASSRYDAPPSEASSYEQNVSQPYVYRQRSSSTFEASDSTWEDEWITDRSMTRSSPAPSTSETQNQSGLRSEQSLHDFVAVQELYISSGPLPTVEGHGTGLASDRTDQSRSNSLRFL